MTIRGYVRSDGRKGIRNYLLVAYLVECAHHVAREIVLPFREQGVQFIGFSGCFPNAYATRMMKQLCTHPNVGGVLLLSLGCESFDRFRLARAIADSGRPVHTLVIQETGGTRKTLNEGREWVKATLPLLAQVPRADMPIGDLIVGTICGGSDATSGLTANPAIGRAFDLLGDQGAAVIFEETGELIGCEHHLAGRAVTPELGQELIASVAKAEALLPDAGSRQLRAGQRRRRIDDAGGEIAGRYAKSGQPADRGLIKPGDVPPSGGLYLLDVVPDGEVRFGFPNINDSAEAVELIACGAHLILFSTGCGSVVGSAISPIIKVCANPDTYRRMSEDMDIDAGKVLEGGATLDQIGGEIYDKTLATAAGARRCPRRWAIRNLC